MANASNAGAADPVYELMARHRILFEIIGECGGLIDEVLARKQGRTITDADRGIFNAAFEAEERAMAELTATTPTTKAGARAAIDYIADYDAGFAEDHAAKFLRTLKLSPLLAD